MRPATGRGKVSAMLLRRSLLVALALGCAFGVACGDTTGEPIYGQVSGREEGSGGDDGDGSGDRDNHRECPNDVPQGDSRCDLRDEINCKYNASSVECRCFSGEWHCRHECPELLPMPWDASCESQEGMQCRYDDTLCFCTEEGSWTCIPGPPPCPLQPPEEGSFCPEKGTLCPYPGFSCFCEHDSWHC
jgi:hypothetical protein